MNELEEQIVECPYCGESIDILLDPSIPQQNYIEDCQVCCRPIVFDVVVDPHGNAVLDIKVENE